MQEAKMQPTDSRPKTRPTEDPNALDMTKITEEEVSVGLLKQDTSHCNCQDGCACQGEVSKGTQTTCPDHKKSKARPERDYRKIPAASRELVFRVPGCRRPDCPCVVRKLPELKPVVSHILPSAAGRPPAGTGTAHPREPIVLKSTYEALKRKHSQLQTECTDLRQNTEKLRAQNELLRTALQSPHFCFLSVRCKPAEVLFLTGLTPAMFDWLLQTIKAEVEVVHCSLTLEDHLLAVLMKLKLGLTDKDIAFRFDVVTEADVTNILGRWLPVMSNTLKPLIKWQRKYELLRNMPTCFETKYRQCRCILSSTQIRVHRPTNRNGTSDGTVKYLVGFSPAGAVTFLSAGWDGQVSDKKLTAESGFYNLLVAGDEIIADCGFSISQDLVSRGAALRIPEFADGVHMERVMSRWKSFQILSSVVPVSQVDLLSHMVITCAALTNISKCVVP